MDLKYLKNHPFLILRVGEGGLRRRRELSTKGGGSCRVNRVEVCELRKRCYAKPRSLRGKPALLLSLGAVQRYNNVIEYAISIVVELLVFVGDRRMEGLVRIGSM